MGVLCTDMASNGDCDIDDNSAMLEMCGESCGLCGTGKNIFKFQVRMTLLTLL